jgi:NAD(P)H-dependent nitrite reductase small subunit
VWIKVAEASELSPGEGRAVVAGDLRLALFNDSGNYYAIDDMCPHEGGSLSEGILHAGRVICPLHSWIFDLGTGRCPRETHEPVKTYPARCSDGSVEVRVPLKEK